MKLNAQNEYSTLNKLEVAPQEFIAYHYVAPNPFTDVTYICFSTENESSFRLEIINKMGQRVISKNGTTVNGDNRIQVYRNNLEADKYYYRLVYGKGQIKTGHIYITD